ncbi:MAG: NB-ARC domain-containing protein [Elainellaceae cyanobacterium]
MSAKQRDRGRILTSDGLSRLQQAIRVWELEHEVRCTQERIKELTSAVKEGGLDPSTIRKILKAKEGVDPESIRCLFTTFSLQLDEADLVSSSRFQFQADPNFVGREGAIADLNTLVNRGMKIIVIQARGGVGKTTLARKYLQQEFGSFLEFPIAKETKDIASIESLIEEKLRQLGEEPGREFFVSLDRLKRKLQDERIGILIDNLEPALDAAGKFIEPHRRYVELLRVLADPAVQSVTLITSRERLNEYSISVQHYPLRDLSLEAWKQYFQNRFQLFASGEKDLGNEDELVLAALHNAYGGNAKAMDILCGAILSDYAGDMATYWQANQDDLLIERPLEDLVVGQFDRLQQADPDAYNLLCRMGCYRYQDVPTVPIEGLLCLLWDVPENRRRRVVKALQDRSLVECEDGEYWLHSVIRSEAIERLRGGGYWERAHSESAAFWKQNNQNLSDPDAGIRKLEAYYQYLSIKDWNKASEVLLENVDEIFFIEKMRDFGYIQTCMEVTKLLLEQGKFAIPEDCQGNLHAFLGDLYAIAGDFQSGIRSYREALKFQGFVRDRKDFYVDTTGALALLYLNLGQNADSIKLFEDIVHDAERLRSTRGAFLTYIHACLSLLHHWEGNSDKSWNHLDVATNFQNDLENCHYTWIRTYGFYHLGKALTIHGQLAEARETYQKLEDYSNKFFNLQAKGYIRNGRGMISFQEGSLEEAIEHYQRATEIFHDIGAKFDEAEAYYELGLTYQATGEVAKSNERFQEAIQLFSKMDAPKQVERVRQSMSTHTND